ncbi:hypothetical protein BKE56_001975 [Rhodococcus sp. M8]|nr:hypothetical protein BKE56_001975 [Rhodococcus sp. M8]
MTITHDHRRMHSRPPPARGTVPALPNSRRCDTVHLIVGVPGGDFDRRLPGRVSPPDRAYLEVT